MGATAQWMFHGTRPRVRRVLLFPARVPQPSVDRITELGTALLPHTSVRDRVTFDGLAALVGRSPDHAGAWRNVLWSPFQTAYRSARSDANSDSQSPFLKTSPLLTNPFLCRITLSVGRMRESTAPSTVATSTYGR